MAPDFSVGAYGTFNSSESLVFSYPPVLTLPKISPGMKVTWELVPEAEVFVETLFVVVYVVRVRVWATDTAFFVFLLVLRVTLLFTIWGCCSFPDISSCVLTVASKTLPRQLLVTMVFFASFRGCNGEV